MSPGEDGEDTSGDKQSTELMSGGLINTRSTTGDEVFFRFVTASLRVTPVRSTPFTFNRISPRERRGRLSFGGLHYLFENTTQAFNPCQLEGTDEQR